jgi:hypothetical protein
MRLSTNYSSSIQTIPQIPVLHIYSAWNKWRRVDGNKKIPEWNINTVNKSFLE